MLRQYLNKGTIEAGCDEAGRGCLAGPVFAAAVILSPKFKHTLLNDSKQLSLKTRLLLKEVIEENAISYSVKMVLPQEIDRINILNASILAMHKAVDQLSVRPQMLLIDGNRFNPYPNIPHKCIIKGDEKFMSIAAASILAKTYRDNYMAKLAEDFPNYGWERNKGYPTKDHRKSIKQYGITPHHRITFRLIDNQTKLVFDDNDME